MQPARKAENPSRLHEKHGERPLEANSAVHVGEAALSRERRGASMSEKPLLISYTRFSSPEQALGDSERRQIEAAKRYANEHQLKLDDKLTLIDRGLSGYKGAHRKGAFG